MQIDKLNLHLLVVTRQYLLYTIGLAVLILALFGGLFIPQARESYDTFTKLQNEKPNTAKLTQKKNALDSIPATAEYAQIEIVDKALPSRKPVLELLTSLNTVSQNTGVRIESFNLSPGLVASDSATEKTQKSGTSSYGALKVAVDISGTFKQVQDFIIQVERVSPFTTVTTMDLSGTLDETKAADADQQFKASLDTETYFFTQSIAVRVDTPLPIIAQPEQLVLGALAAFAPINVPLQTEVTGGGTDDLFKAVKEPDQLEALQQLLNERNVPQPSASPTSDT
jgi:Tfp pilus assembly protein PilO